MSESTQAAKAPRPKRPPSRPPAAPKAAKPEAPAAAAPDNLVDFLNHLKAVNDRLPEDQRFKEEALNALVARAAEPGAVANPAFRTEALWMVSDWARNGQGQGQLLYIPQDLRLEGAQRAADYPGLKNDDLKGMLRGLSKVSDQALIDEVRAMAVRAAGMPEKEQHGGAIYKALGALEYRLSGASAEQPRQEAAPPREAPAPRQASPVAESAPEEGPPVVSKNEQASRDPDDDPSYSAGLADEEKVNRNANKAVNPRQTTPEQDENIRAADVERARDAEADTSRNQAPGGPSQTSEMPGADSRDPEPTTPPGRTAGPEAHGPEVNPPMPGTAEKAGIRIPFPTLSWKKQREADRSASQESFIAALRQNNQASQGLDEAVTAYTERLGPLNREISQFAADNNMKRADVMAEMKEGGKAAHLRRKLDAAHQADPGLREAHAKVQEKAAQWRIQRSVLHETAKAAGKTLYDDALRDPNIRDSKIGERLKNTPGRQPGKTLYDEIYDAIKQMFEKIRNAVEGLFRREQANSHDHDRSR
ncbi:MAG: hypothetical protein ABF479_15790 [Gluconacetobacter sp.]